MPTRLVKKFLEIEHLTAELNLSIAAKCLRPYLLKAGASIISVDKVSALQYAHVSKCDSQD